MLCRHLFGMLGILVFGGLFSGNLFLDDVLIAVESADDVEFFEKRIRPVLVERCYSCHNSTQSAAGELALDHRQGMLEGGTSGPAIVPADPQGSLLLQAILHVNDDLRMPKDDGKLSRQVIEDFEHWIETGAVDPREHPPSGEELLQATSWETIHKRRQKWWSFQPIKSPEIPLVENPMWSDHPIDRFLLAKLEAKDIPPVLEADRRTVMRRLAFVLTGLPPTFEEMRAFEEDQSESAYDNLVTRLLTSEHFGERWARHWMDLFRYCESHGSEGDVGIPYAQRYRNYLIRGLNADVPYDQLVREHIAGDLLVHPRINQDLNINESALGVGHFRMVEHGFSPVDPGEELAIFTDNQIDVISKAFLGLTVSCARCHNHKFDPISQNDFYSWYGILRSCRPATMTVDTAARRDTNRAEMEALKPRIKAKIAREWLQGLGRVVASLPLEGAESESDTWKVVLDAVRLDGSHSPLYEWLSMRAFEGDAFKNKWQEVVEQTRQMQKRKELQRRRSFVHRWNLTGDDYQRWFRHGTGLPERPTPAGAFSIFASGEQVLRDIYPAGVYTHLLSNKHNGSLTSPEVQIDFGEVWVRMAVDPELNNGESRKNSGRGGRIRFVVENYPRALGLLYESLYPSSADLRWHMVDPSYFKGDMMHLEIATDQDVPVEISSDGRSWFGVAEVVCVKPGESPPEYFGTPLASMVHGVPESVDDLRQLYQSTLQACIEAWRDDSMTDEQAGFLGFFVRHKILPNTLDQFEAVAAFIAEYRDLEAGVPLPIRAPGIIETVGTDQPLFVRGDHHHLGDDVPRHFLDAFDGTPYETNSSGRLELAYDLASRDQPLLARVMVNRIWHHVFGRGIVSTPVNFGHVGAQPTHPEVLDYLAQRFIEEGFSIKSIIRLLVTSKAFRLESNPSKIAAEKDPDNDFLSHMRLRRLEAEAIRDAMTSVSGRLVKTMFGNPGGSADTRRSIYLGVRRNSLDRFLQTFDAPPPFSTKGRRNVTNVPAQALVTMNHPFVINLARSWGDRVAGDAALKNDAERVERFFEAGLGRKPLPQELSQALRFLEHAEKQRLAVQQEVQMLYQKMDEVKQQSRALVDPIRERILAERKTKGEEETAAEPPLACWEFDGDLLDSVGEMHGRAVDNAYVEDGALVLDGASYVQTAPIPVDVVEKTLEVWVRLKTLDQGGGGALTIQTPDGVVFDSIVYAERLGRKWMAGSDGFRRTKDLNVPNENEEALTSHLHMAIVYDKTGHITCFRDGQPYGQSYLAGGPIKYQAGRDVVLLGMRHGTPSARAVQLSASIERAQLHARALTAEEIAASASGNPQFVSRQTILKELSSQERAVMAQLETERKILADRLQSYSSETNRDSPNQRWYDLAQAIFNFKEFIYLK